MSHSCQESSANIRGMELGFLTKGRKYKQPPPDTRARLRGIFSQLWRGHTELLEISLNMLVFCFVFFTPYTANF